MVLSKTNEFPRNSPIEVTVNYWWKLIFCFQRNRFFSDITKKRKENLVDDLIRQQIHQLCDNEFESEIENFSRRSNSRVLEQKNIMEKLIKW